MRGCVKAVLLLILVSVSSNLSGECTFAPRVSIPFRATAYDVSVDGNSVWLATGHGVQLIRNDSIVASIGLPGMTRVVQAVGNGIAYAGSGAQFIVLRQDGGTLRRLASVPVSGSVNDIEAVGGYAFVATTNGINHISVLDPSAPLKTTTTLQTSSANVSSLAKSPGTLYAADGDGTVEVFSTSIPALPQRTGALETLPRASAVHTTPEGLVLVSDRFGQNTDIFAGTNRIGRLPIGANSFAATSTSAHFVAGPDRTVRAVDFSVLTRTVELFEQDLLPTDGTDNVIHTMAHAGNTLYVAAGDIGLVTFDVSSIVRPFPLVGYAGVGTNSVRALDDKAWFANGHGTVSEQTIVSSGLSLAEQRSWDAGAGAVIHDLRDGALLTSAGVVAKVWSLATATPTAALTVTFPKAITAAAMADAHMIAVLVDGSVWTVPSAQSGPQKANVPLSALLTRSGSAILLAELRETEGKTVLHYYSSGNLTSQPRQFTIDGLPIGNIALDAARAAVFTFTGVNVVDLASGNIRTIAGSNETIPVALAFAGNDLIALESRRLLVYDDAQTLIRTHPLPAESVAVDVSAAVALMATSEGMSAARYLAVLPEGNAPYVTSYYEHIAASANYVYLYGRDGIDIVSTLSGQPRFVTSVSSAGTIGIAANATTLYTLGANASVTAYSPAGVPLAQVNLSEGNDTQALSMRTAGNAVWVSLSTGCLSGSCQRKTIVLDPLTLAPTATMAGAVDDVTVSGSRAHALIDLPDEIRVLNIADPLRPAQIATTAKPASATSIAWRSPNIHVLGDRLYSYNDTTLAPAGQQFTPVNANPQQIRISGDCAIVIGRSEHPQLYSLPGWTPSATTIEIPSPAGSVVFQNDRVLMLTSHSLEIWSAVPLTQPSRRRAVQ